MDYSVLVNYHRAKGADVTIATTPADEDHATHLGILTVSRLGNKPGNAKNTSIGALAAAKGDGVRSIAPSRSGRAACLIGASATGFSPKDV